ncbi:MAG: HD domain-containing protein [bacterium]|nr:HD domain-containing protein [bacterium]
MREDLKLAQRQLEELGKEINLDEKVSEKFYAFNKSFQSILQKVDRLESLIEVSQIVNSTLQLKELLPLIMESTTRLMKAEASSLMLIDEGHFVFEVAIGEKKDEIKKIRLPITEGVAGWVAQNKQPISIKDVTLDPRFCKKIDKEIEFVTKSLLCVPLLIKDKIIGVVEALNKIGEEGFSQDDLELLQAMANQGAIAIENARLYEDLKDLFFNSIKALVTTIEAKDPYTRGHSERVMKYSQAIVSELNLPDDEKETIRLAGLLHDIGKIGISEAIIRKPDRLTDEEFAEIMKHPTIGAEIIKPIKQLQSVVPGVWQHHERYDGGGYPNRLKGEGISFLGRVLAVADTFDAMTSDRPYRKGLPHQRALEEIKEQSDRQFDPDIAEAFLKAYEDGLIIP